MWRDQDKARAGRRKWYAENKEVQGPKTRERVQARRAANRAIVEAAKDVPCTDCGVRYPCWVMHFDHIGDDKDRNVSLMAHRPVGEKRLLAEIAKCEVVCANCHAERTHERQQHTERVSVG